MTSCELICVEGHPGPALDIFTPNPSLSAYCLPAIVAQQRSSFSVKYQPIPASQAFLCNAWNLTFVMLYIIITGNSKFCHMLCFRPRGVGLWCVEAFLGDCHPWIRDCFLHWNWDGHYRYVDDMTMMIMMTMMTVVTMMTMMTMMSMMTMMTMILLHDMMKKYDNCHKPWIPWLCKCSLYWQWNCCQKEKSKKKKNIKGYIMTHITQDLANGNKTSFIFRDKEAQHCPLHHNSQVANLW